MSAIQTIVGFSSAPHVLPPQARADALRLLGDTLAGGAAGAASVEAAKVLAALPLEGDAARLLNGGSASAPNAAFFRVCDPLS